MKKHGGKKGGAAGSGKPAPGGTNKGTNTTTGSAKKR